MRTLVAGEQGSCIGLCSPACCTATAAATAAALPSNPVDHVQANLPGIVQPVYNLRRTPDTRRNLTYSTTSKQLQAEVDRYPSKTGTYNNSCPPELSLHTPADS